MDRHTRDNWRKIKVALEAAGKTDSWYYRRAVAICQGRPDPVDHDDVRFLDLGDA
jgi:hypothetical protein